MVAVLSRTPEPFSGSLQLALFDLPAVSIEPVPCRTVTADRTRAAVPTTAPRRLHTKTLERLVQALPDLDRYEKEVVLVILKKADWRTHRAEIGTPVIAMELGKSTRQVQRILNGEPRRKNRRAGLLNGFDVLIRERRFEDTGYGRVEVLPVYSINQDALINPKPRKPLPPRPTPIRDLLRTIKNWSPVTKEKKRTHKYSDELRETIYALGALAADEKLCREKRGKPIGALPSDEKLYIEKRGKPESRHEPDNRHEQRQYEKSLGNHARKFGLPRQFVWSGHSIPESVQSFDPRRPLAGHTVS